jgi:hypothetical protein
MNIEVSTFKILKEAGANGAIKLLGSALLLSDAGDKVEWSFSVPSAGKYKLVQKVRLGDKSRNNNMVAAYLVAVNDSILTYVVGAPGAFESRFGGSYWGTITEEVSLSAGTHRLSIESKASYTGIDNPIEVALIEASVPSQIETISKATYDTLLNSYNTLKAESSALKQKVDSLTQNYAILKSCLSVDETTALDKLQKIIQAMKAIDSII